MTKSLFKIHPPIDIHVSDFFKEYCLGDWSYEQFYTYTKHREPKLKENSIKERFESDLSRISVLPCINKQDKSRIGIIKKATTMPSVPCNTTTINNNGVYVSNSTGVTLTDTTINNFYEQKKRKIDHTDVEKSWEIESQQDIWEAWKQYLDHYDKHLFCLEKSHIIECGYSIMCKPHYPKDLYNLLCDNKQKTETSPFKSHVAYALSVLKAFKTRNQRHIIKALADDDHWDSVDKGSLTSKFVYKFFYTMNSLFMHNISLQANEKMFNHKVLWPILQLATSDGIEFIPGEIELAASEENYNADAVIKSGKIEICVLETSGHYKLKDKARFGYDHVKGAFAAVSMLRSIYKKYCYSTKETAIQLCVYFLHARGEKVHLWSLENPCQDMLIMQRVALAEISSDFAENSSVLGLGNFVWALRKNMIKTTQVLNQMAKEHEEYVLSLQLGEPNKRESLCSYVEREITKPKRGSGYGLLLPEETNCEVELKVNAE